MRNTRIFLTLISCTIVSVQLTAQVKFGLKAGMNLANISQVKDELNTKMRFAYHGGVNVDFGINRNFSFQTGLLFTSKGYDIDLEAKYENQAVEIDGYHRTIYNYIELPLYPTIKIEGFQIFAGPYVAMGISGKEVEEYTVMHNNQETERSSVTNKPPVFGYVDRVDYDDFDSPYNRFDIGLSFGLGYKIGTVLMNAGYSLGLGNHKVTTEGSPVDPKDKKTSNRVITISLSYFFGDNDSYNSRYRRR